MNLDNSLQIFILSLGCTIESKDGIWFVTTPDGIIWSMTEPMIEEDGITLDKLEGQL